MGEKHWWTRDSYNIYEVTVDTQNTFNYALSGQDRNGAVAGNYASITLRVGDQITFNKIGANHPFAVRMGGLDSWGSANVPDDMILSGTQPLMSGQSLTFKPTAAGAFHYECTAHQNMIAEITVLPALGGYLECAAGFFSNSDSTCTPCAPGTAAADAGTRVACEPCAAGSYAATEGSLECTLCSPGSFAGTEGSVACDPCPVDYAILEEGATVCEECGGWTDTRGQTGQLQCAVRQETQRIRAYKNAFTKMFNMKGWVRRRLHGSELESFFTR